VDGYFILPYTIGNYLADELRAGKISTDHPAFAEAETQVREQLQRFLDIKGNRTATDYHKELGLLLYDKCGVQRTKEGLESAIEKIRALRADFWENLRVPGTSEHVNTELEKAGRVADYLELAELMCYDALTRDESCGAHFREEFQTAEGEAERRDEEYQFVSVWEYAAADQEPVLHREELEFETIQPSVRSYK
jgi:succinate dehydrogenase / fumarate reductase flavoprotein subunit